MLRAEPKVARMLLRRLIGPLVLYDERTRPDFVKADAVVKTGLIDGLAEIQDVASPAPNPGAVYTSAAPDGMARVVTCLLPRAA